MESIKEISPSRFIGSTRVSLSEGQKGLFLVGQELSPEELTLWSEVTGAKFSLFDKNHKKIRSNSSEEVPWSDKGGLLTTISGSAYYSQLSLLKDTLGIQFFIDRPPYWQAFKKKRNSLFFLGSGLFLFGIILSMVIAKLLSGFINRHSDQLRESHPEYDLLITEIESLRDKKA